MEIIGSIRSASLGMQQAHQQLGKTAQKIAAQEGEPAQNMVSLISAEDAQKVNVDVVKTAEEMLKELMNMTR